MTSEPVQQGVDCRRIYLLGYCYIAINKNQAKKKKQAAEHIKN
jgi:hypothetical protein